MFKVGLTGGIASGKTAVADRLAELGAMVIDTDMIARDVVAPGQPGLDEIVTAFGTDVLLPDGALNRSKLRSLIFTDDAQRQRLENILHPRIRERTLEAIAAAAQTNCTYLVIVVPLLVETDFTGLVDRVLVVDTDTDVQRQRLMERDSINAGEAERIIGTQASREQRLRAADDVLANNGSLDELRKETARLHAQYLDLAGRYPDAKP